MRLLSAPTLGFAPLLGRHDYPAYSLTLIAKAVVSLSPGGVCTPQPGQHTVPSGDVPYPDAKGGPRYESDFVHFKAAADVMVVGHYHAPGGRPVQADEVRLEVGDRTVRLAVLGKRLWSGKHRFPQARGAEPFTTLELRWEHALGGFAHASNPVGCGYVAEQRDFARTPLELPRLERPQSVYWQLEKPPEPLCFAPVARTWPARQALAGTYDAHWQRTRWPWFAEDCKPAYFSACVSDLRVPGYLRGDERLCVTHMHPDHSTYVTQLPGVRAVAAVQRRASQDRALAFEQVNMALDTLWIDMDAEHACLVWRGVCKVADLDASDIAYAWADFEPLPAASTGKAVAARAAQAVADEEAQWAWSVSAREPEPAVAPRLEDIEADPMLPPELAEVLRSLPVAPAVERPLVSPEQEARWVAQQEKAAAEFESSWTEPQSETGAPLPWTRERVQAARVRGESLAGLDLGGLDLRGVDFGGADLKGTLFTRARLDAVSFRAADLSEATLEQATLDGTDFSEAQLRGTDLSKSSGQKIVARKADLSHANLSACTWPDACFDGAQLTFAIAHTAELPRGSFADARMAGVDFEDAQLNEAVFQRAEAGESRWVRAALADAVFTDCALAEADFTAASLMAASFQRSDLSDATLEDANLVATKLSDCTVTKLRAAGADLSKAQLFKLNGVRVILTGANLADAALESCQLRGIDLSEARLPRARLRGCDLRGALFVSADLTDAALLGCDCFEASFETACLLECDGSGSSFFRAEFLGARSATFHGRARDLTGTKLAATATEE